MSGETTETTEQYGLLNPKNAINAVQRVFGSDPASDGTGETNHQGEILWTLLIGWVVGNSIGTRNTLNSAKRLNLGPVYFW